ncbi:oligomeric golgi complex component, COG2-domain-containing protein [Dipodascopsis uninucleata]
MQSNGILGHNSSRQNNIDFSLYDDDLDADEVDENGLPFPKPIQRESFAKPEIFDPDDFLLSQHRFQRLEDLHSQLSQWSSVLQKELVDLINRDYADFVGLSKSVPGGSNKVEDMKLAVIRFRREVESIASRLTSTIDGIDELLLKKKRIAEKENIGRRLLLYSHRIRDLELQLDSIKSLEQRGANREELSTDFFEHLVSQYLYLKYLRKKLPKDHPFLKVQDSRLDSIRSNIVDSINRKPANIALSLSKLTLA